MKSIGCSIQVYEYITLTSLVNTKDLLETLGTKAFYHLQ
jgi:hypothetical protein